MDLQVFDKPGGDLALQKAHTLGARVVRLSLNWDGVAPATRPPGFDPANPEDPAYNWAIPDAAVQRVVDAGLEPLFAVVGAPSWAQPGAPANSVGPFNPSPSDYAAFGRAAALRYDGHHGRPRVRDWQAWNEPNVTTFLSPQWTPGHTRDLSPYHYRRMVNAFSDAVHTVSSANVVVAGGLSPFTVNYRTVKTIGPLKFMREFLCMSAGAHPHPVCGTRVRVDVWAVHPYTSGNAFHQATNPNDLSLGDLPEARALLEAAQAAGHISTRGSIGLWATEFSWDSSPPDPNAVPLALEVRWFSEAMYQFWRNDVSLVVWFGFQDQPLATSPNQSGLYYYSKAFTTATRRKAIAVPYSFPFVAYRQTAGLSIWGRTPTRSAGPVTIQRRSSGSGWRSIGTARSDRWGVFTINLAVATSPHDWVRAQVGSAVSAPFSLTQPPDRVVHPFG